MFPSEDLFRSVQSTLVHDLTKLLPELLLTGAILCVLAARAFRIGGGVHAVLTALPFVLAAAIILVCQGTESSAPAFGNLLMLDEFSRYLRGLLVIFAASAMVLGLLTGIPDRDDSADYIVMLLGGTLGMMLMTAANHLLMVFIGLEMASLPCYALAGFLKDRRIAGEAALKYVLYGSAASGVALFGISLLVVSLGTASLPATAEKLTTISSGNGLDPLVLVGFLMLMVGFAYKLAAVPFHFWCPDVFAGSAAEVAAFLSVASKAAALGLLLRVVFAIDPARTGAGGWPWSEVVGIGMLVVAAATTTFGNLAALVQNDIKRLLAYSTIAHAGYMLLAVSTRSADAAASVLYYLTAYLPTNLGAFAVVANVRNRTGLETIEAFRGLMARSPWLGTATILFFLSLLGLPPLGGFAGKFQVFAAVYEAGRANGGNAWVYQLGLALAIINTILGAAYYLRVVRAVTLDEPVGTWTRGPSLATYLFLAILATAVVLVGLLWDPIMNATLGAALLPGSVR